ncbi:EAL domain-containing protein [Deinococcus sp. KSM4-11]|uniref:putative bifunctional diguanylate cyclase/phosphodiesterase n=1 Tax=Deinococcus sp. KSM4-11 TaxID=2568654 RepID=UPI0010A538A8|nr:EAL domain-containing protein [Deinococcus sp. KSM4-11]THF84319.1 EAL domain-containing protein [Deinococcus sp. KSM4-11]
MLKSNRVVPLGLLTLLGLLHASWMLFRWGPADLQPFLAGLLYVPTFLTAAAFSTRTARRVTSTREVAAWNCISVGLLAFGVAQVIFTYLQVVRQVAPFPSMADALFLLFPPFVGAALLLFPRPALSRAGWLRLGLDVGIMTAAAGVFSWRFLLADLVMAYRTQPLAGTIALAYPSSDLLLLCLLLLLLARHHQLPRQVTVTMAAALTSFIVADTGFAELTATQAYVPGHPIDLFWGGGALLFGVAAVLRSEHHQSAHSAPALNWTVLTAGPYLAVAAAALLLLDTVMDGTVDFTGRGVLWSTLLVITLVLVRQAAAFAENAALTRDLHRATQHLELRVAARTAELHTANEQLLAFSLTLEDTVQTRTAELELSRAHLAHLAQHDALTGLPNRVLFGDRLGQAVAAAARYHRRLAVLYLDLDGFKLVNDTLGHEAGDEVLRVTARRLQEATRQSDTVARLGGDEFIVLLTEVSEVAEVATVAQRILAGLSRDIHVEPHAARVTASIGIALYPDTALDAAALHKQADAAMYRAKHGGKNNICYFASEMNSAVQARAEVSSRLRTALTDHELYVVYQPLFSSGTRELASLEALLRWSSPTLGEISPAEFIPIAEDSGQIIELEAWVLNEVCRQQSEWQCQGVAPALVAVNVSPLQFARPGFVDDVRHLLGRYGLDGRWLELELTERIMLQDLTSISQKMRELRALGVGISIDDFGAGNTALSYFFELPVTTVKIDRSLIQGLGQADSTDRVVQAIVALAHSLHLNVVAEGVETWAQLTGVTEMGCERVQGYLLARPERADVVRTRLSGTSPLTP